MKIAQISPLAKPVIKTVSVPGSKSYTNRALILAALTQGQVTIQNPLISDDTVALITCLQTLGIKITQRKHALEVSGSIKQIKNKTYNLDADFSGTTMRFLLALCCVTAGTKILTGKPGLIKRPIKDLVEALKQLGATIEYLANPGFPPVKISTNVLHGGNITISGTISSQFLSSLLMVSPLVGDISINITGHLISKPYVEMTIASIKQFGATVTQHNFEQFTATKQTYHAKKIVIEGDFSSACYFGAIAALTKSTITIQNINPYSVQADKEFFSILEKMGNEIILGKNSVTVRGTGVKPIAINMQDCPDQIQTLAVLAAFAKGKTIITGAQSLKLKETNRLFAIKKELEKMGIEVTTTEHSLTILGGNPKAATIDTYNDHRMAMAFAVAGSILSGMRIKHPEVVSKTFPAFWESVNSLGITITIEEKTAKKVVLIGFMGTGKSSIAPLLAKRLKSDVIEMDDVILKKTKSDSIKQIFLRFGEKKFRELEEKAANFLKTKEHVVISAGGGVIMNDQTINHLSNNAVVIFLDTTFETIIKRLSNTTDRPLWKDQQKTQALYAKRKPIYEKYADIVITTDGKSLGFIVTEIEESLQEV